MENKSPLFSPGTEFGITDPEAPNEEPANERDGKKKRSISQIWAKLFSKEADQPKEEQKGFLETFGALFSKFAGIEKDEIDEIVPHEQSSRDRKLEFHLLKSLGIAKAELDDDQASDDVEAYNPGAETYDGSAWPLTIEGVDDLRSQEQADLTATGASNELGLSLGATGAQEYNDMGSSVDHDDLLLPQDGQVDDTSLEGSLFNEDKAQHEVSDISVEHHSVSDAPIGHPGSDRLQNTELGGSRVSGAQPVGEIASARLVNASNARAAKRLKKRVEELEFDKKRNDKKVNEVDEQLQRVSKGPTRISGSDRASMNQRDTSVGDRPTNLREVRQAAPLSDRFVNAATSPKGEAANRVSDYSQKQEIASVDTAVQGNVELGRHEINSKNNEPYSAKALSERIEDLTRQSTITELEIERKHEIKDAVPRDIATNLSGDSSVRQDLASSVDANLVSQNALTRGGSSANYPKVDTNSTSSNNSKLIYRESAARGVLAGIIVLVSFVIIVAMWSLFN